MPREYIEYKDQLPINIYFNKVIKYPIHWHNSLEIIYVVEGTVSITIETETHKVNAKEIEIINPDEAHSIKSISAENKILIFYIDPVFLNKYYDIENRFFYTDFSTDNCQKNEKYLKLRKYLCILVCEFVQRNDEYEENIENKLIEILYYLINKFHYLIYDEDGLKENEIQFERYDRIIKYIYTNYDSKISIRDVAKREFLSSHYLSAEIKNKVGYSFNDFLNLTRVEEAIKILLDTDKNISEISEELGFSHTRYFNKHFKIHYKCTPNQYRKKYKLDSKTYENYKKVVSLSIKNSFKYLNYYLEDYERFNYEGKIKKINIDISSDNIKCNRCWDYCINLGNYKNLLKSNNYELLKEFKKYVQSQYVFLQNIFCKSISICSNKNDEFIDWYEIKIVLDNLYKLGLKPNILIDEFIEDKDFFIHVLKEFIIYFKNCFGKYETEKWKFSLNKSLSNELKLLIIKLLDENNMKYEIIKYKNCDKENSIYDTLYMLPYLINNYLDKGNDINFLTLFDDCCKKEDSNNELFYGGIGLINRQGMKKSSYYAYCFLSHLGKKVLYKGEGYVVTKNNEGIDILIYYYDDNLNSLINSKKLINIENYNNINHMQKKFSINISGLEDNYKVITYKIDEKVGDLYNNWMRLGKPKRVSEEERKLLIKVSSPYITLEFIQKPTVYNIISKIQGYGCVLISMQKVQKHFI